MAEINNRIEGKIKGVVLSVWREDISVNKGIEQICQLFPQPLDNEKLREKAKLTIAEISQLPINKLFGLPSPVAVADAQQDKDFALLPDIEKAKREERERIVVLLEDIPWLRKHHNRFIEALKGDKDEK